MLRIKVLVKSNEKILVLYEKLWFQNVWQNSVQILKKISPSFFRHCVVCSPQRPLWMMKCGIRSLLPTRLPPVHAQC